MSPPLTNSVSGDVSNDGGAQLLGNSIRDSTFTINVSATSKDPSGRTQTDESKQKRQELLEALDFPYREVRMAQVSQLISPEESFSWVWGSNLVKWLKSPEPLFWIAGKPASGKSTLMNYLIRNSRLEEVLQQNDSENWTIIYYFFDFRAGKDIGNNFEGFLRSLLYQIVKTFSDSVILRETGCLRDDLITQKWTVHDLYQALMRVGARNDLHICFFVDGLDEYEGNKSELISFIRGFASSHKKICLACRPDPPFPDELKNLPMFNMEALNKSGIMAFGKRVLTDSFQPNSPSQILEVTNLTQEVIRRARGVFLWARFAVYELIDGKTSGEDPNNLLLRLEMLPPELEDVYSRIVERRTPGQKELLRLNLQLIVYSHRVLSLGGLYSALLIACEVKGDTSLSMGSWDLFEKRLRALSGGMVDIVTVRYHEKARSLRRAQSIKPEFIHLVQTAHKTVQTYLDQRGWLELLGVSKTSKSANELWLQICVRYLKDHDLPESLCLEHKGYFWAQAYGFGRVDVVFSLDTISMESAETSRNTYNSLDPNDQGDMLEYTITLTPLHALQYERQFQRSTLSLLLPVFTNRLLALHSEVLEGGCHYCFGRLSMSAVEFAALHALELFVKEFLSTQLSQHKLRSSKGGSKTGFRSQVSRIFSKGKHRVELDTADRPIQVILKSSFNGMRRSETEYMGIIRGCLSISGFVSDDALALGIANATVGIVALLLSYRRDKPLLLKLTMDPLLLTHTGMKHAMASRGSSVIVSGLYILFTNTARHTSLEFEKIGQLLLEHGEDINALSGPDETPMNAHIRHCRYYDSKLVQTIINYGADINKRGPEGNVLEIAWSRAHTIESDDRYRMEKWSEGIKQLISSGGINNRADPNGEVPSEEYMLGYSEENFKGYVRTFFGSEERAREVLGDIRGLEVWAEVSGINT